ncbi:polyamine aminopropyltransferase [Roseimaritima ulvae]|uniref:Polyamine aminopropyltransferase n=1 Tax=Roseimaritima ulvae TaxID=980254 RepID=A0A5B9QKM0_9BACT|nr:polyamine aminopropyltransferase [Roseimaritima ulvae]QEG39657.1 Spermidine synthase [Roseimaritima ulvae]
MNRAPLFLLYMNVLVIATCGLIYELLAGTLASYLLGDSVTQFSLVIGVYLSALGAGAWLSQYVEIRLARTFIEVELALALVGGLSAPFLFVVFAWIQWFQMALFGMVFLIGVLVGLELPLLMRILKEHLDFNDLVSRVLTFDYIGALLASLLFPILLVPQLGLVRTSLVFGILNALVGLWGTYLLRPILTEKGLGGLRGRAMLTVGLLMVAFVKSDSLTTIAEETMLANPIVFTQQTPYQRIVVTQNKRGFQLHLNGHLQFNSADEYRYHEALVHPALSALAPPRNVLVLGGGDGLAVREILKYPSVESVTLVDIDPAITSLATDFALLSDLNQHSLDDPRVTVVNQDAFVWISQAEQKFDVAVIDFPDPGTFSVGKLYTTRFFRLLRDHLSEDARLSIQCTSPLVAPQSYWCIINTLRDVGFDARPYSVSVPTFGVWGFAYATMHPGTNEPIQLADLDAPLRFLTPSVMQAMFDLPSDITPLETELNKLNNQILVRYYDSEWSLSDGT